MDGVEEQSGEEGFLCWLLVLLIPTSMLPTHNSLPAATEGKGGEGEGERGIGLGWGLGAGAAAKAPGIYYS